MARKRGQEVAGNAAGLVIFIGFIIIIYLFILRPEDRADLLDLNDTEAGNGGAPPNVTTLMQQSPGSLFANDQKSFEHPLNQLVLSSQAEDRILAEKSSLYVMNSKLDNKNDALRFEKDTKTDYTALVLSFYVKNAAGKLIIKLNGNEVFYGTLNEGNADPIKIDTELLEDTNYLEFSVPKVPWYRFWGRNQYEIRDIKLIANSRNKEAMQAVSTFRISQQEVDEFDHGYLRFTEECKGQQEGILKVYLNGNLISSSVSDCQGYKKFDIAKEDINPGKNEVLFALSEGTLYLTNMEARIELKEARHPVYYFDINNTTWESINGKDVFLKLEFVRESNDKEAEIEINRRKFYVDTKELDYSKNIKSYIQQGSNYISLIPKNEMEIANLKVYVDEES